MSERNKLVSYAMDFASYLFHKVDGINRIILHGSVARGDYDNKSDIDLFVDIDDMKKEKKVLEVIQDYYKTKKFSEWKMKGISNQISVISGKIDSAEWKSLKRAIISTGIVLYGKYKAETEKIYSYVLFSFENIKPERKRVSIFRKLFGFKFKKQKYSGLVEKMHGIKIGKGSVVVPTERANELKNYLKERGISPKVYDFWTDTRIN